jgi:O-antigen ligase
LVLFFKKELLPFFLACFLLPTEAAFSLVFYAVLPLLLWRSRVWPPWPASGLILWSGLTLLWGEGDTHRVLAFGLGAVCTYVYVAALLGTLSDASMRRQVGTLLIWAGAANALWAIGRGVALQTMAPQLLGWGVTHHPILGASVMAVCLLTALIRALAEPRFRWAHAAACAVMTAFILLTEARGPLLACVVGAAIIGAGGRWRGRAFLALICVSFALHREPESWRRHQIGVLMDRGLHDRPEIWSRTLELIREKPLFGHGLAANLDLPGITFPHDLALGVLFYSGLVGFALFVWLLVLVAQRLMRMPSGPERLWLIALCANAMVAGLTDLGQITKGPGALWFIFWLPVGLVLAYPTRSSPGPCSDSQATA